MPAGATIAGDGEGWNWVSSNPTPYSGALAHQSALLSGEHQHYFYNAATTLSVAVGDTLFAYVYLDPANPPSEVMLQWNDGSWEHRAYWGANLIGFGTDGTASRHYMGAAAGQRDNGCCLAVPAAQVGLEGRTLNGMAYTLYNGRATWDYAGKTTAPTLPATTTTLASSLNPSTVGTPVTLTATVTGSSPTGSVSLADGGSALTGCTSLALTGSGNTRTAACTTSSLAAATHSLVASYSGDSANAPSSSTALSQVVNGATATATASFVGTDTTTQGNWKGVYGSDGYNVIGDTASYPAYAQVTPSRQFDLGVGLAIHRSARPAARRRQRTHRRHLVQRHQLHRRRQPHRRQPASRGALQPRLGHHRAGTTHRRPDASSGSVLDSRSLSSFNGGQYLVWTLSGHVTFRFTWTAGYNAVLSGLFFDAPGSTLPATTTTLASSLNPSTVGTPVTLTATVTGSSPTGSVSLADGGSALTGCTSLALSGSGNTRTAACTTSSLAAGTHSLVASYSGDAANAPSSSTALAQVVNATTGTTTVWVDDAVPAGATIGGDGEGWNWVSSNPTPYSGALAHQSALLSGEHQHFFYNAVTTLPVAVGDTLFTYVYLDPANPPSEVMLQWNDGSWEHRAYWGANSIAWGTNGTVSRHSMGPLPATGQWVLLAVPAAQVGLEGHTLNGMAYTLYNGRATWDYAGKLRQRHRLRPRHRWRAAQSVNRGDPGHPHRHRHRQQPYRQRQPRRQRLRPHRLHQPHPHRQRQHPHRRLHHQQPRRRHPQPRRLLQRRLRQRPLQQYRTVTGRQRRNRHHHGQLRRHRHHHPGQLERRLRQRRLQRHRRHRQLPRLCPGHAHRQLAWVWASQSTDPRALLRGVASGRIAATWYSATSFTVDVNLTDGNPHRVALYNLDWDTTARVQRIDVLDASSGSVLDSRSLSSFNGGQYLVWTVSGHVTFRFTWTAGYNAVLSGLFFN